jgi:rare lipoprotein A
VPARTPSIEDLIQTYDAAPSAPVPVPMPRGSLLSYAAAPPSVGAQGALASMMTVPAAPETIELGALDDVALLMRVASLADGRADLNETMADGKVSLSLNMRPGEDADTLLREVWDAGASDAFVLRADER